MPKLTLMRAPVFVLIGLVVGIAGAVLFQQSLPPEPGSLEARLADLDRELNRTRIELAAAQARAPEADATTRQKLAGGARSLVEDFKDGKTVDMNDVFQAAKPALRDFSPIFERLQRKQMRRHSEYLVGDLARKYHLSPAQQEALRSHLNAKTDEQLALFREHHLKESTTLEDMVKSGRRHQPELGVDEFMANTLTGADRAKYQADRLNQRVTQVQGEADHRVSRLHSVVNLDETQQDRVFALMARSSPQFDPSMQLEGLGGDSAPLAPGQSRDEAIMDVLRPEQRQQYEEHRIARRAAAGKEMEEVGLKLPDNWDMFGDE